MGCETENDSSSEDELMRRSRLNTGASVASAASALSATSVASALSAASAASAASAGSSHTVGKLGAGNSNTSFPRDNFNRKSRCVKEMIFDILTVIIYSHKNAFRLSLISVTSKFSIALLEFPKVEALQ